MAEALDQAAIERWRGDPCSFVEEVLRDPETGRPFRLLPCERTFLRYAYQTNDAGRLVFPEQTYGAPKKTGKTAFAAMHTLTTVLVYGGRGAEGYCIANDYEQAQGRVFAAIKRICEASRRYWRAKPTFDKTASSSPLPVPPSPRSPATTPAPPAPTRLFPCSTRPGRTPRSAAGAYGMKWSRCRPARSPAA